MIRAGVSLVYGCMADLIVKTVSNFKLYSKVLTGQSQREPVLVNTTRCTNMYTSAVPQVRKSAGLEDVITYGAGLVILLHGKSGTG